MFKPEQLLKNLQPLFDEDTGGGFGEDVVEDEVVEDISTDTNEDETAEGTEEEVIEFDFKPFLEKLNDGRMQHDKAPMTVEGMEQVIEYMQRGKNQERTSGINDELKQQLEEAQNNPDLAFSKEVALKYGYNTPSEYEKALRASWEQEKVDNLIQQNIPKEYAEKMIANENRLNELETKSKGKEEEDKIAIENTKFLEEFKDVDAKTIPWEQINEIRAQGYDLTAAYAIHLSRNIDTVKTEAQQDAIKKMSENADTSTGSINDQTSQEQAKMSNTQVDSLLESMTSGDRDKWLDKNYSNLEKWGYFKKS